METKKTKCADPLDCLGCGACVTVKHKYDDPLDCMIEGEHLSDCDEDGYCNLCGHQESEVVVMASLDPDYGNDFCGTVTGTTDDGELICIRDQEDNVWAVEREAIRLAD